MLPTSGHLIFIPAVLIIGIVIGFLLGTRAVQDRVNAALERERQREQARAQRQQRKASTSASAEAEAEGKAEAT